MPLLALSFRTSILAYALFFSTSASIAQVPDWLVGYPVSWNLNPGMPRHVLAASPGGHLMSARLVGPAFSYSPSVIGVCAVERLDPGTGQPMWSCALADSASVECGAVDDEGNVYVAGKMIGDLVLCDGSVLAHSQGGWLDVDLYLMKFDAAGALLWARNLELTQPGVGTIGALAIDPDGSLWYATTDFVLTRINKVDADGNDVESRYIDGGKSIGGMSFDQAGGLYVSGSCDGNAFAFGGINPPLPVNEPYLMYLARFKPDGTGDWARFAHDITFKHPMVVADGQGHAYLAGELMDSTSWGGVLFNGPDWGTSTFLAKVDSSGQFLWGIESDPPGGAIDGDLAAAAGACVALDGAGRPYITGTLRGLVDWGGGVVSDGGEMTTRTQTIVAFDTDGTPLWATSSAPTSTFLNAMAITAMNDGTLHFSAHVNGPYEFPPLSINEGGGQAYTLGRISSTSTGIIAHGQDDAHFAYPSPFSSGFSIMPRPSGTALLRAFDAEGRLLYQGGYHEPLGAGWPSGLYTVEVNGSGTRRSFRVVKE